ncbi:MAG: signal peptidase [Nocardioides sp.]|nr:signal peptidase [Nocardioides sp.]
MAADTTVSDPATAQHPPGAGEGIDAGPALAWAGLVVVFGARAYRSFLLTLVVIATVPMLWSWSSYVVRSASMEPSISRGDVVVAQPFTRGDRVPVGRVMVFDNPSTPDHPTLLVHRVVERYDDGTYATAGDANAGYDTSPLTGEEFRARATILVPYVGSPFVWMTDGNFLLLVGWALLTVAAFVLASRPRDGDSRRGGSRRGPLRRVARRVLRCRRRGGIHAAPVALPTLPAALRTGLVLPVALLTGAFGVAAGGAHSANAAFTSRTTSGPNTWAVAAAPTELYNARVLADSPYAYYHLDEASGASMADSSSNGRTGTYASVSSYRLPDGLPNNAGYAVGLNGATGRLISGGTTLNNPTTFSVELWFKTTTTAGGKVLGFESTKNATSPLFDRHVFMRPDGRLVYGGWTGPSPALLTTPSAYNNGVWHHLVLTASGLSATMYVDGVGVVTGSPTRVLIPYSGWWRVGYGTLPTGTGYPASANFVGSFDNVAVYQTALPAARVAAHYAAR